MSAWNGILPPEKLNPETGRIVMKPCPHCCDENGEERPEVGWDCDLCDGTLEIPA